MQRAALEARILARLAKHAAYDPLAWLPVIGSSRADGARHGLAAEFFGASPRRSQLESLERGLFHLAREQQIEVARFAGAPIDGGPMPRHPRRHDNQTYLSLTLRPDAAGGTFAVRLPSRADAPPSDRDVSATA